MKKNLFFLFLLVTINSNSQTQLFIENGKVWEVYDPCGGKAHYKTFRIDGDTLINGRTCYKMYCYELEDYRTGNVAAPYSGISVGKNLSLSYLYEDEGKVYRMLTNGKGDWQSVILYDFTLCEGDIFTESVANENYTVTDVSTTDVMGTKRKRIRFDRGQSFHVDWLEGIGGFYHLYDAVPLFLPRADTLYYCGVGNKTYYQMNNLPSANEFFVDGKRWTYADGNEQYEYQIAGETTIGTEDVHTYGMKLYKKNIGSNQPAQYVGMVCDGEYLVTADGNVKRIYNFNLQENDWDYVNGRKVTVLSITTKSIEGYARRVFTLKDDEGNHYQWIEGIGSITDFAEDYPLESTGNRLMKCTDHRVVTYEKSSDLLADGRYWLYNRRVLQGEDFALTRYEVFIFGDTVIDGRTCKKLYTTIAPGGYYCREGETWFPEIHRGGKYHSAWYEEDKKVYRIAEGSEAPELMFDYGMKKGDKLPQNERLTYWYDDTITVDGITSEKVPNYKTHSYRRMRFAEEMPTGETKLSDWCLVEGIGGTEGLLFNELQTKPHDGCIYENFEFCAQFLEVRNDEGIYEYLIMRDSIVMTTTGIEHPEPQASTRQPSHVYDLQGRPACSNGNKLRKGVYVRGGRKYVVK